MSATFEAPADTARYRQCEHCGDLAARELAVCPACGKPVLRQYGPPFDELRERTGASLGQCRRALSLSDGDVELAAGFLAGQLEEATS